MKKHVYGRKFKRDANERKALFKNLLTSLVLEERIKTTEAKAKAIKAAADKLITKVKKGEMADKLLHADVNQDAVKKLIADIAPRFAKRAGGYTRIIKIGKRRVADNAEMVYIEWTEQSSKSKVQSSKSEKIEKKVAKAKKPEKVKKETKVSKTEPVKPVVGKKVEEKVQKQGIFKRLITRQKKGQ